MGKLKKKMTERMRTRPVKGMGRKEINELPDRILFAVAIPPLVGVGLAIVALFFLRSIPIAVLMVFLGFVGMFIYMILINHRWKRRISYREYQESRMGRGK